MKIILLIICIIVLLLSVSAHNHNTNKAYCWKNNPGHWLGTALSLCTDIVCGWYIIHWWLNDFGF